MHLPIGFALLAFALAVGGGAVGATLGTSHHRLCALISLGAGTLLGVTVFAILPEAFGTLHWWGLLLAAGSGYVLFALITRYIFHVCPACAASHFDEATTHRFSEISAAMMLALAIHCTADGLALAAGHEEQDQASHVNHSGAAAQDGTSAKRSRALDFSLVMAVCVHKVPEGLALGALLLGAGFAPRSALLRVSAVEAATLAGAALGLAFLRNANTVWLDGIVAHVGGGFLFLAKHAVAGEIFKHHKSLVLVSFGIGIGVIGGLTLLLRWF
ncbi:MAG: hypothetical protein C5B50_24615 [Verrucomicrobia bacterium]|nr:MAG: hypothetical protein C5B50_24615 [Verrucomicrobiota bacterium]